MRTILTAFFLFLFGLSSAFAAPTQTIKTWTLKNGTKVTHISNRSEDGKLTSWHRTTESKTGRQTLLGKYADGEKYRGHVGSLGNTTIRQTIIGSGEKQQRVVQITNHDRGGTRFQMTETARGTEIIKADRHGLSLVRDR